MLYLISTQGQTSLRNIGELLGLIVIFIIVLIVCYYTTKFVAGRQVSQKRLGNFDVIETFPISQNKYLQLVRMGKKFVVISVTKDGVQYITELPEEDICYVKKMEQNKSFQDVFTKILKNKQDVSFEKDKENNTDK